uniref:Uncharacterized protein n=1 Tax=Amphimedon queenslandica TaxID=400682 RepID=A0A1X7VP77_AMPQE
WSKDGIDGWYVIFGSFTDVRYHL